MYEYQENSEKITFLFRKNEKKIYKVFLFLFDCYAVIVVFRFVVVCSYIIIGHFNFQYIYINV